VAQGVGPEFKLQYKKKKRLKIKMGFIVKTVSNQEQNQIYKVNDFKNENIIKEAHSVSPETPKLF
jgi:hypothetical protein